ncbi:MAG: glycosyltransferase family A protein [bacterium]
MREELLLNSKKLTLSVFISNYNHGHCIGRAIEAVASQSRLPDELIIVDDGSTDDSVRIVRGYAKKYAWLKLIVYRKNRGVQVVLGGVMAWLKGEYVYFGAADDYIPSYFFAEAMDWAERYPEAGMIFGEIKAVSTDGEKLYTIKVNKWNKALYAGPDQYRKECLESEVAGQSFVGSTIFRKSALMEVGGFRLKLGSWCDSFAARAIGLRYGVCYVPRPFMTWVISPDSLSHSTSRRPMEMWKIINRAGELMRSREFKNYFPEQHVRRWQRGYKLIVLEQYLLSWLGHGLVMRMAQSEALRRWRRWWLSLLSK